MIIDLVDVTVNVDQVGTNVFLSRSSPTEEIPIHTKEDISMLLPSNNSRTTNVTKQQARTAIVISFNRSSRSGSSNPVSLDSGRNIQLNALRERSAKKFGNAIIVDMCDEFWRVKSHGKVVGYFRHQFVAVDFARELASNDSRPVLYIEGTVVHLLRPANYNCLPCNTLQDAS